jgi:DNA polymerase III delta subunit
MYICGEDKTLVADVLKAELAYRPINQLDFVELDGKDPIADIMAALDQYAKDGYRVVVLHNADELKKWGPVITWLTTAQMKTTNLICVGNDVRPDTKEQRFRPFVEKGRFVECKPLSEEQLLEHIVLTGKYTQPAAQLLIERTAGSTARVFNEMNKLSYLPGAIDVEAVQEYVEQSESERFVEALFNGDKRLAMKIASSAEGDEDFGRIFGALEYTLSQLVLLVFVRDKQLELRDIAERTDIPIFLVGKYLSWAKGSASGTLYRRIKLLANADAYHRRGTTVGVLERLVSLW